MRLAGSSGRAEGDHILAVDGIENYHGHLSDQAPEGKVHSLLVERLLFLFAFAILDRYEARPVVAEGGMKMDMTPTFSSKANSVCGEKLGRAFPFSPISMVLQPRQGVLKLVSGLGERNEQGGQQADAGDAYVSRYGAAEDDPSRR